MWPENRSPGCTGQAPAATPPPAAVLRCLLPWGWGGWGFEVTVAAARTLSCPSPSPRPLVSSHGVLATTCPWEDWALLCPRPHGRCGGYQLGPLLLHLFVSLLISTTRLLPPKTMQQVSPVPGTPKTPMEEARTAPRGPPLCTREPAELPVASPVPLHLHPRWAEDPIRNPPRKERPSRATQHPPAFKSLRSHRDTLHTFPRDRPDPKTLDQGRPLRGGASPPGLSLRSHPSSG